MAGSRFSVISKLARTTSDIFCTIRMMHIVCKESKRWLGEFTAKKTGFQLYLNLQEQHEIYFIQSEWCMASAISWPKQVIFWSDFPCFVLDKQNELYFIVYHTELTLHSRNLLQYKHYDTEAETIEEEKGRSIVHFGGKDAEHFCSCLK